MQQTTQGVCVACVLLGALLIVTGCGGTPAAEGIAPVALETATRYQIATSTILPTNTPTSTSSFTPTSTATGTPTPTPNAAQLEDQIAAAWESGDWATVIMLLNRQQPQDRNKIYAAHYNYAQWLLAQGRKVDAVIQLQLALINNPNGGEAQAALLALTPTATPTITRPPPPPTATRPAATSTSTTAPFRPPTSTPTFANIRVGAICRDGTTSGATGSGACSGHGGVRDWIYR